MKSIFPIWSENNQSINNYFLSCIVREPLMVSLKTRKLDLSLINTRLCIFLIEGGDGPYLPGRGSEFDTYPLNDGQKCHVYLSVYLCYVFPRMLLWFAGNQANTVSSGRSLLLQSNNWTVSLQDRSEGRALWWVWGRILESGRSIGMSALQLWFC